jgi:uncharacterized membrane protein YadS
MQTGTLVKLLRVLMLGPLVLLLFLITHRPWQPQEVEAGSRRWRPARYMPWFIAGFLLLSLLNSLGLVPRAALAPLRLTAGLLTTIAMAALGLGVDLRALGRVGVRVTAAAAVSLLILVALSLAAIRALGTA